MPGGYNDNRRACYVYCNYNDCGGHLEIHDDIHNTDFCDVLEYYILDACIVELNVITGSASCEPSLAL